MRQILLAGLIMVCCANPIFAQPAANQDSILVEKLFDDYFREYLKINPEEASLLGLPKAGDYIFDHAALDDVSAIGIKANLDLARRILGQLEKINAARLANSQKIDVKTLSWFLKLQLEGEKFSLHRYNIDHLFGAHNQIVNLMTSGHTIDNMQDAHDYLSCLENIPLRLEQTRQRIELQEKKGIRPSVYIIERLIGAMDESRNAEPRANLLYIDFKSKIMALKDLDSAGVDALCQKAELIIKEKVYPAYATFTQRLQVSKEQADSLAGVWKLPDGDQYYQYCLKYNTTSSLSPEKIYQLGLAEVKAIQDQVKILFDSLGIAGGGTYGELMQKYWATWKRPDISDKFSYAERPGMRTQILRDYRSLVDSALILLPQAFGYIPRTKVTVEAVPEYKEQGGLTYYEAASLDGRRKATFFINLASAPSKPGMRNLIYHETIPGHHYQIALQQELTQNRMYKNLFFLSGFGEGWAMYVEDLAREMGWLPDIYSRIAELNSQLFRAVRIVLDAGIHFKKWTKAEALQYMADNLGWNSENEIDRYIVWPGQACSYTIGKLKIMEMRKRAQKSLGSKFDLKDFHMAVLQNGSVPLDILEEIVNDYIRANR